MNLQNTAARLERLVKGMAFDCRGCGQCVLSQTGLVCPMTCPKGLRNGPCGGSLNGRCEVRPDHPCVWVKIHEKTGEGREALPIIPSPDASLFNTSSYLNAIQGLDKYGRTPLPPFDGDSPRVRQPIQTLSSLEAKLKGGKFVITTEVRSPRSALQMSEFSLEVARLGEAFDALFVTAFLKGRPGVSSGAAAARIAEAGFEVVCQCTCRDLTRTTFIGQLLDCQATAVHNVMCLTGDAPRDAPLAKSVFSLDSALMLYEARHIRATGAILGESEPLRQAPAPFLGAVINPFTTPKMVPIRRLKQKAHAGADFIVTQVVLDTESFAQFMNEACRERLHDELFILAGIPLITSVRAAALLRTVPGVHVPPGALDEIEGAPDADAARRAGIALALRLADQVFNIPGVSGIHMMHFGGDSDDLRVLLDRCRSECGIGR